MQPFAGVNVQTASASLYDDCACCVGCTYLKHAAPPVSQGRGDGRTH